MAYAFTRAMRPLTLTMPYFRRIHSALFLRLLLVALMLFPLVARTQSKPGDKTDSSYVSRILNYADQRSKRSINEFNEERLHLQQQRQFERIRNALESAKNYLRENVDTAELRSTIETYDRCDSLLRIEMPGSPPGLESYRNLSTQAKALSGLHIRVTKARDELYALSNSIDNLKYRLDSLSSDPMLLKFPDDDSVAVANYAAKLMALAGEIFPIDSSLSSMSLDVQALLNRTNLTLSRISSRIDRMESRQSELSAKTFTREVPYLWNTSSPTYDKTGVMDYSIVRTGLALKFYLRNHLGYLALLGIMAIIVYIYLNALRKILEEEHLFHQPSMGQLVLRYPALSGMILSISILQFVFPDPPAVFTTLCSVVSAVCLTFIIRKVIHRRWMWIWLAFLLLFMASGCINLILVGSDTERWLMLILALFGILIALISLLGDKSQVTEKRLFYFVIMVMAMEILSVVANVFGRYNLAKNLLTTGYLGLVIAMLFLWVVRFINEGLEISFHIYTLKDRKLFNINFDKVGSQAPGLLYVLLIVGWVVMVFRNFYIFRLVSEPLRDFIFDRRSVGEYSFSIANILTFILIMLIAAIVSRVVSFFASDRPQTKGEGAGLGSLLLLVRIGIFTLGIFLAFAAAGIPMDKVTIILGALSVGIGFGLQTLVNNLVSGLILAFERPVNVGDIVEINGQAGIMKSIGFRSSRISTWDGADVIMPNGDLLSGHLVNWTGGDTRRRMEVDVGIAYGSDLVKVERIIKEVLANEPRVIAYPEPLVFFQGFGDSAISVKLYFWVGHFRERLPARSQVIMAIDTAFRENHITIPFPQRDVHITDDRPAAPETE